MNERNNSKLTHNAQELRKGMTKEERHLWYDFLKRLPVTFNRQKVMGLYIADFYCAEKNLIIELDGSQHYMDEGQQADKERDAYFFSLGLTVLRYSNRQIHTEFDRVCTDILRHLATSSTAYGGPPCLAAARSTRGSDTPLGCHSLPLVPLRYPQGEG